MRTGFIAGKLRDTDGAVQVDFARYAPRRNSPRQAIAS